MPVQRNDGTACPSAVLLMAGISTYNYRNLPENLDNLNQVWGKPAVNPGQPWRQKQRVDRASVSCFVNVCDRQPGGEMIS